MAALKTPFNASNQVALAGLVGFWGIYHVLLLTG